jgi:hypothetical protein
LIGLDGKKAQGAAPFLFQLEQHKFKEQEK